MTFYFFGLHLIFRGKLNICGRNDLFLWSPSIFHSQLQIGVRQLVDDLKGVLASEKFKNHWFRKCYIGSVLMLFNNNKNNIH